MEEGKVSVKNIVFYFSLIFTDINVFSLRLIRFNILTLVTFQCQNIFYACAKYL